jgi:hypothetical protein
VDGPHPVAEAPGDDGAREEGGPVRGDPDRVEGGMPLSGDRQDRGERERRDGEPGPLPELERDEHDRHDGQERRPARRVVDGDDRDQHAGEQARRTERQHAAALRPAPDEEAQRSG